MKKLLVIFGTRPEAIKLAPLIKESGKYPDRWNVKVCITAQHREMLDQVLSFFKIKADHDLALMKPDQTLFDITAKGLKGLEPVLNTEKPDLVIVQGDTATAFVGSLAAYYKQIKVAHVEAGLRSGDKYSPFPEEINRKLTASLTDFHFAPTTAAKENLAKENITEHVYVTGNTVIDALFLGLELMKNEDHYAEAYPYLSSNKKLILITGHRRESFGDPFRDICTAIREIAEKYPKDLEFIYPVHLNPNVQKPVKEILKGHNNIHLVEPVNYPHLLWLMQRSYLVLTDSGGIQEEAPSLGKPVLVMRDVTERMEGVAAGTARLVGTNKDTIINAVIELLEKKSVYEKMSQAANPYGDGTSSAQIMNILTRVL